MEGRLDRFRGSGEASPNEGATDESEIRRGIAFVGRGACAGSALHGGGLAWSSASRPRVSLGMIAVGFAGAPSQGRARQQHVVPGAALAGLMPGRLSLNLDRERRADGRAFPADSDTPDSPYGVVGPDRLHVPGGGVGLSVGRVAGVRSRRASRVAPFSSRSTGSRSHSIPTGSLSFGYWNAVAAWAPRRSRSPLLERSGASRPPSSRGAGVGSDRRPGPVTDVTRGRGVSRRRRGTRRGGAQP